MSGFLVLEDETVFRGESVGAPGYAFGEAVFTTAMTGYQEVVTDPSYCGQIVCFTAPMVGNYGVAEHRSESSRPHARAVVMREARGPEWTDWLHERCIPALTGLDTRALVLHLRERGAMRGAVVTGADDVHEALTAVRSQPSMSGAALAERVSTKEPYVHNEAGAVRVAVVDYGAKRSILRRLAGAGASVTVFPHDVDADTLAGYDGVLLSNGPGDPEPLEAEVAVVRDLLGRVPVLGICLGHQLLALANGLRTYKLPFGHRGANHPVVERDDGPRARHEPEPRLRRRGERRPARHARVALRRHRRGRRLPGAARALGAVPPRGRAGPARRLVDPRASGSRRCALPRRDDIHSICLIGSGPIVIGQACEFDYAGCQALKVLRDDGYETIVVNSNPATIMTDPGFADRTYIEPLDLEGVADVLRRDRPDALLPTMGGQTALNLALELHEAGVLDELGVELIGAKVDAIARAEDRELFKAAVESCGLRVPTSRIVTKRGRPRRRRPARGRAAGVHARRPRRRLRRRRPTSFERQVERGLAESPDRPGARRGVACAAGTSSSSRSSATAPTTS